jgi:hypothetical protein
MRIVIGSVVLLGAVFVACGGSESDLDGPVKCGSTSCGSGETCVITFGGEAPGPHQEFCPSIVVDAGNDASDDAGDAGDAGPVYGCPSDCFLSGGACMRDVPATGGGSSTVSCQKGRPSGCHEDPSTPRVYTCAAP